VSVVQKLPMFQGPSLTEIIIEMADSLRGFY